MNAENIRSKVLEDDLDTGPVRRFELEIFQEIAAQLAELNETLNGFTGHFGYGPELCVTVRNQ